MPALPNSGWETLQGGQLGDQSESVSASLQARRGILTNGGAGEARGSSEQGAGRGRGPTIRKARQMQKLGKYGSRADEEDEGSRHPSRRETHGSNGSRRLRGGLLAISNRGPSQCEALRARCRVKSARFQGSCCQKNARVRVIRGQTGPPRCGHAPCQSRFRQRACAGYTKPIV